MVQDLVMANPGFLLEKFLSKVCSSLEFDTEKTCFSGLFPSKCFFHAFERFGHPFTNRRLALSENLENVTSGITIQYDPALCVKNCKCSKAK